MIEFRFQSCTAMLRGTATGLYGPPQPSRSGLLKKLALVLPFCFLIVSGGPAQADPPPEDVLQPTGGNPERYYLTAGGGINLTIFDGDPTLRTRTVGESLDGPFNSGRGLAPLLHLTVGRYFSPQFSLALGLDYDPHTVSNSAEAMDTCRLVDAVTGGEIRHPDLVAKSYDLSADYVNISLLGNFHLSDVFFYVGPSVGVPIGGSVEETDRVVDPESPCSYFPGTADQTREIVGQVETRRQMNLRLSIKVGVGYTTPLTERMDLLLQADFDGALNRLFQENVPFQRENPEVSTGQALNNELLKDSRLHALQGLIGIRWNF